MTDDKLKRMKELISIINTHSYNYYSLGTPTISDNEWDKLYDSLVNLEEETGIVLNNSPSKKIGYEIVDGFSKHYHEHKLYSLNKCNNMGDLRTWYNDINKKFKDSEFTIEHKYDGLTISLIYDKGYLLRAATRGDGLIGEDVTAQIKVIKTVPIEIPFKGRVIVHGEAIMKLSNLAEYNKRADEPLKNARNAVAGAIRNLDTSAVAKRRIDLIAFSVIYAKGMKLESQRDEYDFLRHNKFYIAKQFRIFKEFDTIEKEINEIDKLKDKIDFLIDGAVIKLNDKKIRDELGYTEKFPRWAIAYKFKSFETSTDLINIIWQVGRTGKITPIAILTPVEIAGATVQRATLNNYNDILRKKIKSNSRVFIRRSNEVIPEVLGVAEYYKNSKEIQMPYDCPSCGHQLKADGANLFCENSSNCKEQIKQKISHFVSRGALNIDGISDRTIELLINEKKVKNIIDVLKLKHEDLDALPGYKEKKINNLIKSIQRTKHIDLDKFIYSLGISGIGKKASKQLVERFSDIDKIIKAKKDEIEDIHDFGEIMAKSVSKYFSKTENIQFIHEIINLIEIKKSKTNKINTVLKNKIIVITGTIENVSRPKIIDLIEGLGGSVGSAVSNNTNFIVVGQNPGSKLDKAKKLGITAFTYDMFLEYIDNINKEINDEDNQG